MNIFKLDDLPRLGGLAVRLKVSRLEFAILAPRLTRDPSNPLVPPSSTSEGLRLARSSFLHNSTVGKCLLNHRLKRRERLNRERLFFETGETLFEKLTVYSRW
jgi:hypothetical protein